MIEAERRERLVGAEWNTTNLDPLDVEVDLAGDALSQPLLEALGIDPPPDVRRAREPDLAALASVVYGPAHYVFASKGRSAELVFAQAAVRPGDVVVGHPLFFSTMRALTRSGARVEVAPLPDPRSSDLDLEWLARRLAASPVQLVCVEAATNANGGRPIGIDNVEAVHVLCRRHGARLLLDATRLLANCERLGGDVLTLARRFTALCDAFWVGCSKELLVTGGGLVGVKDVALTGPMLDFAFAEGSLLHPLDERLRLARGLEHVAAHPELVSRRARQLETLAASLRDHGLSIMDPVGCHAVYVDVDDLVTPTNVPAITALLYLVGGVRCAYQPLPMKRKVLRLPLGIGAHDDARLATVAPAFRALFDRIGELPVLRPKRAGQSMFFGGLERVVGPDGLS